MTRPGEPAEPQRSRWAFLGLDKLAPRRRVWLIAVVTAAVLITAMSLLLIAGAWRDDRAIESNLGHTDADVLYAGFDRTVVRFTTPDGGSHSPPLGVLYPQDLQAGQRVQVEYDTTDPDDLVRVAGRDYRLTFLPFGMLVGITWAVAAGLIWWLRRPRTPATT
ncbi:hypothetical protein JJ691_83100 [Kutzneria sp. CA-103260]|nr:hypothetical protein JJ691_83100 [Kutzneria sp. CA-103260]